MSFEFNWERMSSEFSQLIHEQLQAALTDGLKQAAPADAYVRNLEVERFSLGDVPPYVEILSIEDGTPMGTLGELTKSVEFGKMGTEPVKKPTKTPAKTRSSSVPIHQRPKAPPKAPPTELLTPGHRPTTVSKADGMPWIRQADEWIGPDGLSMKVRFTYGGNFHCKVKCVLQYSAMLEDTLAIGVELPVSCHIRNLKLNCIVLCNLKDGIVSMSIEKRPPYVPLGESQQTEHFSEICHMVRFDLMVAIGGHSAEGSVIPNTQWAEPEDSSFTLPSLRSVYSAVWSFLWSPRKFDDLKSLCSQGMHRLQQIQEKLQRRLFQQVAAVSPVTSKSTSEYVDERVISAFVRDRINFWLEENVVQPNFIRMAG